MATVTLRGGAMHTNGDLPAVGDRAPDFCLTTGELADKTLADWSGRRILLNIVPSLDTPTCALSTRKFNEHAAAHPNCAILVVSADLPFAQGRFCSAEGLENVVPLQTLPERRKDLRLLGVAVQAPSSPLVIVSSALPLPHLFFQPRPCSSIAAAAGSGPTQSAFAAP